MPTRARTLAAVAASVAATASLTLGGQAVADHGHGHAPGGAVPAPPAQPTSDAQLQNLDQVKTGIKAYYGDTVTTTPNPVDGTTPLHTFAPDGAYAHQTEQLATGIERYLDHPRPGHGAGHGSGPSAAKPAIVLDVDDTSLNTYSYEIWSNFVYNPTTNATFVNSGVFPAVPGMPDVVQRAEHDGYTVFFLTGRPGTQRAGTLSNLASAGYGQVPSDQLYLKDYTADTWLSSCAPSCTTIQYKSLTRQHIEQQGYDIVANVGDQYSDLKGGFANRTYKVPNPMYYLP